MVTHLLEDPAAPRRCARRAHRLEVELHHTHLPLLDDVVDYRRSADRIEPARNLDAAEAILETISDETVRVG